VVVSRDDIHTNSQHNDRLTLGIQSQNGGKRKCGAGKKNEINDDFLQKCSTGGRCSIHSASLRARIDKEQDIFWVYPWRFNSRRQRAANRLRLKAVACLALVRLRRDGGGAIHVNGA